MPETTYRVTSRASNPEPKILGFDDILKLPPIYTSGSVPVPPAADINLAKKQSDKIYINKFKSFNDQFEIGSIAKILIESYYPFMNINFQSISGQVEVSQFLDKNPGIIPFVFESYFKLESKYKEFIYSLELEHDPEDCSETLILYVRAHEYTEPIYKKLDEIFLPIYEHMGEFMGKFMVMSDYVVV